jgi:hypothetical protein
VQDPSGILLLLGQIGGLNVGGFPMDVSSILSRLLARQYELTYQYRLLALLLLRNLSFTPLPGLFLNDDHQHATEPFEYIAERVKSRIETALSAGLKDERDSKMRRGLATCAALWAKDSSMRQSEFKLVYRAVEAELNIRTMCHVPTHTSGAHS